ncbi:MAG: hypothetical protein RR460_10825 [Clostridium sp.]
MLCSIKNLFTKASNSQEQFYLQDIKRLHAKNLELLNMIKCRDNTICKLQKEISTLTIDNDLLRCKLNKYSIEDKEDLSRLASEIFGGKK